MTQLNLLNFSITKWIILIMFIWLHMNIEYSSSSNDLVVSPNPLQGIVGRFKTVTLSWTSDAVINVRIEVTMYGQRFSYPCAINVMSQSCDQCDMITTYSKIDYKCYPKRISFTFNQLEMIYQGSHLIEMTLTNGTKLQEYLSIIMSEPKCPPSNVCQNNSTCSTSQCNNDDLYCCVCSDGFVGRFCEKKRQKIYQLTTKNERLSFTTELSNRNNEAYKKMEKIVCELLMSITRSAFPDVLVRCRVLSFRSGSLVAESSLEMGSTNGSSVPSVTQLAQGITNVCAQSNTDCSDVQPESGTFAQSFQDIDACHNALLHSCSLHARCSKKGSVDYDCSCNPGFKDSVDNIPEVRGRTCTESCEKDEYCLNRAQCKENIGTNKSCVCGYGYDGGPRCEMDPHYLFVICVSVGGAVILFVLVTLSISLGRKKKKKKGDAYRQKETAGEDATVAVTETDTRRGEFSDFR